MGLEPVFSEVELRKILERGLATGKWSIMQFNKGAREPVLPSSDFLKANPKFLNASFRDLETFKSMGHHGFR